MAKQDQPWWQTTPLTEMSPEQWESLCDGCGRCCIQRFHDDDETVWETNQGCWLLDCKSGLCRDYANRAKRVSSCYHLTPDNVGPWLPPTCAYRLVKEGNDLFFWHHLYSGDRDLVHKLGIGVRERVVNQPKGAGPRALEKFITRRQEASGSP